MLRRIAEQRLRRGQDRYTRLVPVDDWKGKDETTSLVCAYILNAKSLETVGENEFEHFWSEVAKQARLKELSFEVLQNFIHALDEAARVGKEEGYEEQMTVLEDCRNYLDGVLTAQLNRRGESLEDTIRRLGKLWNVLCSMERAILARDDAAHRTCEADVLKLLRASPSASRQSLLLMVTLFLIMGFKSWNDCTRPVLLGDTLEILGSMSLESFTATGPIYFRWRAVEAICLHLLGQSADASEAEDYIITHASKQLLDKQKNDQRWGAPVSARQMLQGKDPKLAQARERRIATTAWATLSLELLVFIYLQHEWYSHRVRIREKCVSLQGGIVDFATERISESGRRKSLAEVT